MPEQIPARPPRATYQQDWVNYNAAQSNEKDHFQALLADLFGVTWAIGVIAGVTFLSGVVVYGVMRETLPRKRVVKVPTI